MRNWVVTAALVAGAWIAPAQSERRRAAPTAAPAKPAAKRSGPSAAVKPAAPARRPQPAAAKRKQGAGTIYGGTGPKDADTSVGRSAGYKGAQTNHGFKSTSTDSAPDYSKGEGAGSGSGSGGGSGSGQSAGSGK
ncbi:MAG: hypothetical protein JNL83_01355 [Myxococcales bacterium]|nr:hypothetical protein [Myxococcales bacterium]